MDIYREIILDHYNHPRHQGTLPTPTHQSQQNNPLCGDQVKITVQVTQGIVTDIRQQTGGCAIATASASILTEAALNQPVEQILKWDTQTLIEKLQTPLTSSRQQCALVALQALHQALRNK